MEKTRAVLLEECKSRGIKGAHALKKADLVALLETQIAAAGTGAAIAGTCTGADAFVMQTMLTCIGNKRKLVRHIRSVVEEVAALLSKPRIRILDGFSGSSVVSRALFDVSETLYTNDLELYAYLMAVCYLQTPSAEQQTRIATHIAAMNQLAENGPYQEGIVCRLYAPKDTQHIQEGERCFYTRENALIIDTLRAYISDKVEQDIQTYCLVPLLNKASIHTNTAGVFKGFYKKGNLGCFGGNGEVALSRITKPIRLEMPLWNTTATTATMPRVHCS